MKISSVLSILAILGIVAAFVQQVILVNYGEALANLFVIFPLLLVFGAVLAIADYIDKKESMNIEVSA